MIDLDEIPNYDINISVSIISDSDSHSHSCVNCRDKSRTFDTQYLRFNFNNYNMYVSICTKCLFTKSGQFYTIDFIDSYDLCESINSEYSDELDTITPESVHIMNYPNMSIKEYNCNHNNHPTVGGYSYGYIECYAYIRHRRHTIMTLCHKCLRSQFDNM